MNEAQLHEEIVNLIKEHIDQPFYRIWMGLFEDRGSVASRPRFQPSKGDSSYSSFRLPMEVTLRITKLVRQCLAERSRAGFGTENTITFMISDDGTFCVEYSANDVVRTGWQYVYDLWNRSYLAGLRNVPVKGPFG